MPILARRELFKFMIEQVANASKQTGEPSEHEFIKWFIRLYFGLEPSYPIVVPDGPGDGKVDAFFEDTSGFGARTVLVNSKFTESYDIAAPGVFYEEIKAFNDAFENPARREEFLNTVRQELKNDYRRFFRRYDNDGEARLIFVTNFSVNPKQIGSVQLLPNFVSFHLDDILQFMTDFMEGAMPVTDDLTLSSIKQLLDAPKSDAGYATHVMFANLRDFVEYMDRDPYKLLFARNVRLNLINSEVNREITATYSKEPGEFAFSNNGITVICDEFRGGKDEYSYTLRNPRVVNGSQTLHSVAGARKHSPSAHVMVKVIVIPPATPENFTEGQARRRDAINKIARRTNTQNKISKDNLRANDERQFEIERAFRQNNLYYERRKFEWRERKLKLKSLGIQKGPGLKELIQLGAAYKWSEIGPAKARSSVRRLFDDDLYEQIMDIAPGTFVRIFTAQRALDKAMWEANLGRNARRRELIKNVKFAMFSLFCKSADRIDIPVDKWPNFAPANLNNWIELARLLFDVIDQDFQQRAVEERKRGVLTATNYTKNGTMMTRLLRRGLPRTVTSTVRRALKSS